MSNYRLTLKDRGILAVFAVVAIASAAIVKHVEISREIRVHDSCRVLDRQ